ncbi:MAG: tetratricopeptide repeat protein [Pseudomonadota bacterium]
MRGDLDPVYAACSKLLAAKDVKPDQAAKYHWRRAEILYRQDRFKETLEAIDASLKLDPTFPPALMRRAVVLAQLLRRDDSYFAARKLYAVAPEWSKSLTVLANLSAYHITFGRREKIHARAVELDPKDYDARKSFGLFLYRRGKIKQAEAQWQIILDADREAVNAQYSFFHKGEDGFELYGSTLGLRGTIYGDNRQNAKALVDFDRLIKLYPDKARGYYLRARQYLRMNELQLAAADIAKSLELLPGYIRALEERVLLNLKQKNYQQVVTDADIVLAGEARKRAWIGRYRGVALRGLGRANDAFESFLTSAKLDPEVANALMARMITQGYYSDTAKHSVKDHTFLNGLMACSIDPKC